MKYLNKKMVVVINKLAIEHSGGADTSETNIRPGLSLSFVDSIYYNLLFEKVLYPTIFHQAAAYMFFIIKNHVFIDGNKRTGLATAITFLQWNKISLKPFDENLVFDFVIDIAKGENNSTLVIPKIAQWFSDMAQTTE